MDPFSTTPKAQYKPENFFPAITDEYLAYIRRLLLLEEMGAEDKISHSEYRNAQEEEPFDVEIPTSDIGYPITRPIRTGQVYNFTSTLTTKVDHLVRCVSHSEDGLCEFERVDNVGESLKDKDILLIVCVFVPAKWCELNAQLLCPLSLISSELSPSSYPNFEIVFVPKMRKKPNMDAYYIEDDFLHFFSAFPGRLALPCTNQKACDYFCNRFNFTGELTAVLLNGGKVVDENACDNIFRFGSAGFPFTRDRFDLLEYELPRSRLANLLGLNPSSQLYKLYYSEAITVEDLGNKLVGLYLFRRGEKLRAYNEVYKQCRDRDLAAGRMPSFEIVLICDPPQSSIHPHAYEQEVHEVLNQFGLGKSWWFLPYDYSACRRLTLLSDDSMDDTVIIVGPQSQYVEPYGGEILRSFGADALPFHRETVIQRYVERLHNVTLNSLLSCGPVQYVLTRDKKRIPISKLQGKNVILYVSDAAARVFGQFEMLNDWCKEIKKHHSDLVVMYLLLKDSDDVGMYKNPCRDTRWLEYPSNIEHSKSLRTHEAFFYGVDWQRHKALEGLRPPEVLLFGRDGKLHLFDARYQMFPRGIKDDPFHSDFKHLRTPLMDRMKDHLEFLDWYE